MVSSEDIEKFKKERDEHLISHLQTLNLYDLERLKVCFEYEFDHDEENRENLSNILHHLNIILDSKNNVSM